MRLTYFSGNFLQLDAFILTPSSFTAVILAASTQTMIETPSADSLAAISFAKFKSLPKTGKPTESEWTVLSSIVQFDSSSGESKVVALGAGTKCIGQSKLCPFGLILNDSHAEVLARRAFIRYVFHQLKSGSTIFSYDEGRCRFQLRDSIGFHFFSTQVPCGDACIVSHPPDTADEAPAKRRKMGTECSDVGNHLNVATVFTGAKLIEDTNSDPMHQSVGALRTKPGRGDRTLSMSCSDKLSKWNVLGLQGAFLDEVLEKPIYFETLNFSCDFELDSMARAIHGRWTDKHFKSLRFIPKQTEIRKATKSKFEYAQDAQKNPSPNGLVWCDIPEDSGSYEICTGGKKQGITKKMMHLKKSSLRISKVHLLEEFCQLLEKHPEMMKKLGLFDKDLKTVTYNDFKSLCTHYQQSWTELKNFYFERWTMKPKHLLNFTLATTNKES